MSEFSSTFADDRLQALLEEYDGDYYRAEADFSYSPQDDDTYYRDPDGTMWCRMKDFGRYDISWDGRVRSHVGGKCKELKPYNDNGYLKVTLRDSTGSVKNCKVHKLVAEYFVPNQDPDRFNVIRHLDSNSLNNYFTNLRYGTEAMNRQDMYDANRNVKKAIYCFETNTVYRSEKEFAQVIGVTPPAVSHVLNKRVDDVQGYHLCFAEDVNWDYYISWEEYENGQTN